MQSIEKSERAIKLPESKEILPLIKKRRIKILLVALQTVIVILFVSLWQLGAMSGHIDTFLFSSPSAIWTILLAQITSGELFTNMRVTGVETLIGFILGAIGGSALGLVLWYSKFISDLTRPFIAAIGSIPVLAVAPVFIIWFGTGMTSKIFIVGFSCVVVSLISSYEGARQVDSDLINLMKSFGASRNQTFLRVVVPSSMSWVISGLKLNVGFALVGAVIGEFISSDQGVGHMITLGTSNFTMSVVFAGLVALMVMVLIFNIAVGILERFLLSWQKN